MRLTVGFECGALARRKQGQTTPRNTFRSTTHERKQTLCKSAHPALTSACERTGTVRDAAAQLAMSASTLIARPAIPSQRATASNQRTMRCCRRGPSTFANGSLIADGGRA